MARVLVVDEHPLLRLLLRTVLENHGHDVREADEGDSAIAEVDGGEPEVVVADLAVSTSRGERLVQILRDGYVTWLPKIIATGDHIPDGINVDATFSKPYSAQAIAEVVDAIT